MQWGMLRVLAMGIILFKRPKSDVLHLDTLIVHASARSRGIGTTLIQSVQALAQAEGKRCVTLDVEDVNLRAKLLYKRLGFREEKFKRLPWPWRLAFTFSGSHRMSQPTASSET
jgi:ribosomal protein S18 acetylase RimI-like enzyme